MHYFVADKVNMMVKIFSKMLAVALSFMLGISQEVAAQYGVVTSQYHFKGTVESGLCQTGVEGIKVSVYNPTDTNYSKASSFTKADGTFEVILRTTDRPFNVPKLFIKAEDVDGEANGGDYLPQWVQIELTAMNTFGKSTSEWTVDYPVLTEYRFRMRKNDALPCSEE